MMKVLVVVFSVCVLSAIATADLGVSSFQVMGSVYCDTCKCGFETDATRYNMPDCEVKIVCRSRKNYAVTYTNYGKTGPNGRYEIIVESDRGDDVCDVCLGKSSDPGCSVPNKGRECARVILTRNNGMISKERHVNSLGYLKNVTLPNCPQILQKYQLTTESWRI